MELRDEFAKAIIQGMFANPRNNSVFSVMTEVAYEAADAMMTARSNDIVKRRERDNITPLNMKEWTND